jgi:hypothetical protein
MKKKKVNYRKKAIDLAKKICRRNGICAKCGKTRSEVQIQSSHILPVEYKRTATYLDNLIPLCASCHKWAKNSWHKSPLEQTWFVRKYPGRRMRLILKAAEEKKIIFDDNYWREEFLKLKWLEEEIQ